MPLFNYFKVHFKACKHSLCADQFCSGRRPDQRQHSRNDKVVGKLDRLAFLQWTPHVAATTAVRVDTRHKYCSATNCGGHHYLCSVTVLIGGEFAQQSQRFAPADGAQAAAAA